MSEATLDKQLAHRVFSKDCFNGAWELIDKAQRTPEEDRQMLLLSLSSVYHWTQREDCAPRNLSIGYWQASRVFALLGQAGNARTFATLCLDHSTGEGPFLLGYAHEAMARAELTSGNGEQAAEHLRQAHAFAAQVTEADNRGMLEADLLKLSMLAPSSELPATHT